MFTSKKQLTELMGVDPELAAFFVDRKVPTSNLYWKDRLLYVARGTGYLFIPLYFDLMLKQGVPRQQVLSEPFVQAAEQILHSAAAWEHNQIDRNTHIQDCKSLVEPLQQQPDLFAKLNVYFQQEILKPLDGLGTISPALNRGDSMLYHLCLLPAEIDWRPLVDYWYALVPSFLLMDDVMDLRADQQKGEENALIDFGVGTEGLLQAFDFLERNFQRLSTLNPLLGQYFQRSLTQKKESPYIQELIKNETHGTR